MKLQEKLLLWLLPLIVLPLLVLGWAAYIQQADNAKIRIINQIQSVIHQSGRQTSNQLRTIRANASLFARAGVIEQYIEEKDPEPQLRARIQQLFGNYQQAYPEYYSISLVTPDRSNTVTRSSHIQGLRSVNAAMDQILAEAEADPAVIHTRFITDPDTDKLALFAAKALFTPQAKIPAGYLVLASDMSFLEDIAKTQHLGQNGYVFFTDDRGIVLYHPQPTREKKILDDNLFPELQQAVAEQEMLESKIYGIPAFIMGSRLSEGPYGFGVYPTEDLSNQYLKLAYSTILVTCAAILLAVTFLFLSFRKLLIKPIRQLSKAAKEIGRGHVLVPIDVTSKDEIGDLAQTFKEMGSNLKQYHEQVTYVAYHDSLTGLPNRMMFKDYLQRAIADAQRRVEELAVLFLDLDNFKRINDVLGHYAGDRLLETVAERLTQCLRETDVVAQTTQDSATDMVARLAGDEFIILLPRSTGSRGANLVAKRILQALSRPVIVEKQEFVISCSIGIALFPDDGLTVDALLKNADIAMYHAKNTGRNNYQFYSSDLNRETAQKIDIERRLRKALTENALTIYYQPQVETTSGKMIGVEALLRWNDPELGAVSPETFIPIAEEYGLVADITDWVLAGACRQNKAWQEKGLMPIGVSVNISGVLFSRPDIAASILSALTASRLDPKYLDIELTETCILEDPVKGIKTLNSLKETGASISLDDFGTGYSSLSYLMQLPIDKVKIDKSFMRCITPHNPHSPIVTAIITMSHSLGMKVIAEGVEEESQVSFLLNSSCDYIQGYYYSKPLAPDDVEHILANRGDMKAEH